MASSKSNEPNKSEEVRQLLKANPKITSTEAVAKLAEKDIKISPGLFYYVKGQIRGRTARRSKVQKAAARVIETRTNSTANAVDIVLRVKGLASEVGGMHKLKELIDALSE
jgi:hypothetical protein